MPLSLHGELYLTDRKPAIRRLPYFGIGETPTLAEAVVALQAPELRHWQVYRASSGAPWMFSFFMIFARCDSTVF